MDYQKIYDAIIERAQSSQRSKLKKNDPLYAYFEKHHIVPKCLGGTDDTNNLVLLTAREHFVCHKLLTITQRGNRKIALAFHRMCFGKRSHMGTSRDFQYARELLSNTPISDETKEKLSKAGKSAPRPKGWHHTQEAKDRISKSGQGKKRSDESKERYRIANTGENNPMYGNPGWRKGITMTDEAKEATGKATKLAMQNPEVKERHRLGLERWRKERAESAQSFGFPAQPPLPL